MAGGARRSSHRLSGAWKVFRGGEFGRRRRKCSSHNVAKHSSGASRSDRLLSGMRVGEGKPKLFPAGAGRFAVTHPNMPARAT
jgi:hypothetical protein